MSDLFPATLAEQIACVERELRYRARVYPRLVETKRMSVPQAEKEQHLMREVLATLQHVQRQQRGMSDA